MSLFENTKFIFIGRFSKKKNMYNVSKLKELIEKHGGSYSGSISNKITHVVFKDKDAEWEKYKKNSQIKKIGVTIKPTMLFVDYKWILRCIKGGKIVPIGDHAVTDIQNNIPSVISVHTPQKKDNYYRDRFYIEDVIEPKTKIFKQYIGGQTGYLVLYDVLTGDWTYNIPANYLDYTFSPAPIQNFEMYNNEYNQSVMKKNVQETKKNFIKCRENIAQMIGRVKKQTQNRAELKRKRDKFESELVERASKRIKTC